MAVNPPILYGLSTGSTRRASKVEGMLNRCMKLPRARVLHDVMVHIDAVYLARYGPWFARYAMQFTVAVRYVMSVWCHYACKDRGV